MNPVSYMKGPDFPFAFVVIIAALAAIYHYRDVVMDKLGLDENGDGRPDALESVLPGS